MVPEACLLNQERMPRQRLLGRKRRAVDALEHRPTLVPAPVGARHGGQPQCLDVPGRRHMRPAAEIDKLALGVDGHGRLVGKGTDQFDLVRLLPRLKEGEGLVPVHHLAHDRVVGGHDGAHLALDRRESIGTDRRRKLDIVEEAVLRGGPGAEARRRPQALDRLRQGMGGGMAENEAATRIREGKRAQAGIAGQRAREFERPSLRLRAQQALLTRPVRNAKLAQDLGQALAGLGIDGAPRANQLDVHARVPGRPLFHLANLPLHDKPRAAAPGGTGTARGSTLVAATRPLRLPLTVAPATPSGRTSADRDRTQERGRLQPGRPSLSTPDGCGVRRHGSNEESLGPALPAVKRRRKGRRSGSCSARRGPRKHAARSPHGCLGSPAAGARQCASAPPRSGRR